MLRSAAEVVSIPPDQSSKSTLNMIVNMSTSKQIEQAYRLAKDRYAALGVDTDKALQQLAGIPVSIHCWQGDDVGGFENAGEALGGGLAVTGNYPGNPCARPRFPSFGGGGFVWGGWRTRGGPPGGVWPPPEIPPANPPPPAN